MLILGRKVGDTIQIGENIRVFVLASDKGGARIGIEAPKDVPILRGELVTAVEDANRASAEATAAANGQGAATTRALAPRRVSPEAIRRKLAGNGARNPVGPTSAPVPAPASTPAPATPSLGNSAALAGATGD